MFLKFSQQTWLEKIADERRGFLSPCGRQGHMGMDPNNIYIYIYIYIYIFSVMFHKISTVSLWIICKAIVIWIIYHLNIHSLGYSFDLYGLNQTGA